MSYGDVVMYASERLVRRWRTLVAVKQSCSVVWKVFTFQNRRSDAATIRIKRPASKKHSSCGRQLKKQCFQQQNLCPANNLRERYDYLRIMTDVR